MRDALKAIDTVLRTLLRSREGLLEDPQEDLSASVSGGRSDTVESAADGQSNREQEPRCPVLREVGACLNRTRPASGDGTRARGYPTQEEVWDHANEVIWVLQRSRIEFNVVTAVVLMLVGHALAVSQTKNIATFYELFADCWDVMGLGIDLLLADEFPGIDVGGETP